MPLPGQVYFDEVHEGDEIPMLRKACTTQQLVIWAGASGDFYQIHYDEEFARGTGLDGIIVHGGLKNAFLGQLLHDWIAPGGVIRRFGCQYRGMDYPNQEILCRGVVTKMYEEGGQSLVDLDIWTENPAGRHTTPGTATVALPRR
ncbi:MAG: dehydratase [Chloroflexi bacterium]|nr:MAG: dehydratase [Chloroflexota bacterium]